MSIIDENMAEQAALDWFDERGATCDILLPRLLSGKLPIPETLEQLEDTQA